MAREKKQKMLGKSHPKVVWSRLKIRWPFVVWLMAVGAVYLLVEHACTQSTLAGVVEPVSQDVAATSVSRLDEIKVIFR